MLISINTNSGRAKDFKTTDSIIIYIFIQATTLFVIRCFDFQPYFSFRTLRLVIIVADIPPIKGFTVRG